jgi:hypothetical protein
MPRDPFNNEVIDRCRRGVAEAQFKAKESRPRRRLSDVILRGVYDAGT